MSSRRHDGRKPGDLRPVRITPGYTRHAPGSVLVEFGETRVICTASVSDKVPAWMAGKGRGWITAEYGMLPGSTHTRKARDRGKPDGRAVEIQRLIGRSLRAVADMGALGERLCTVDCDVIQADGGTRTAAITGGFVALALALGKLRASGALTKNPLRSPVAAVSVGIVGGRPVLDLDYHEDVGAAVDMNVVMTTGGRFIEVQGTGEEATFTREELDALLTLAARGIKRLFRVQREVLAGAGMHAP